MSIQWQHDFTSICTVRHYVIVSLNCRENRVQYVHSKNGWYPAGHTVHELFYRKHKNWKKKKIFENQWWDVGLEWREWRLSNMRDSIGMLTAGMSARVVPWYFQRHESTISRLLNRFQQTGNVADRPRLGRLVKPRSGKTVFSRLNLDAIDFFLVES